jgi:hypothetical protein
MPSQRPPAPNRRRRPRLSRVVSLPALVTIAVSVLVLAGLALLPTVVWQVNPLLWRQLLRLQGGVAGLVLGAVLGFLVGRLTGRRP